MLSYRKLAMRVLGRPLHTGGNDSPRPASQRAAAFILTAAMLTTLAAPAFAKTWHIEDGDITVKAGDTKGTNKVSQGESTDVPLVSPAFTVTPKGQTRSHRERVRMCRTPIPSSQIVRRTLLPTP